MKILAPIDFDNPITLDKQCSYISDNYPNAEIILLNVIPGFGSPFVGSFFNEDEEEKLKQEILIKMQEVADRYFSSHSTQSFVLLGKRVGEIIVLAKNQKVDLIVLGCRKKRSRENQRMLGSTTYGVGDRASCPVLLVR
jgi:nucleotide-binding universal stress UspA family protein